MRASLHFIAPRHWALTLLALMPLIAAAQVSPRFPIGGQLQLQLQQPQVDLTTPVTASAQFDPPVIHPGEKTFYRVNVDASESAIDWPENILLPAGLEPVTQARGMTTQMLGNNFRTLTAFLYEFQPPAEGSFTITNFVVSVDDQRVEIPAATLVVAQNAPTAPPPRQLALEIENTNLYLGQPFRVRVLLPAGPNGQLENLLDMELNGNGLMADKTTLRRFGGTVNMDGRSTMAVVNDMVVTPIAAGPLEFSAEGFSAGSQFGFMFPGQASQALGRFPFTLLLSEPVDIKVRPLPTEGELPGFTGSIGKFYREPPRLATNRLNVGEPVQLFVSFRGDGELSRLAPPMAPRSRDWQIIAEPPPSTTFTLIPLTDDTHETPAIPFSYFDPETGKYVDLTIPSVPVTVVGTGLPLEAPAMGDTTNAPPLKLSAMATTPGKSVWGLKPQVMRGWFWALQLTLLAGFIALWQWDRRRRYLEAHPEIVLRTQARRALRRERQQLQQAVIAGDNTAFVQHAARAMNIAVAPHYPANPRALVSGDVLAQLDAEKRGGADGDTVKQVFAAADSQFGSHPETPPNLPEMHSRIEAVLQTLEERL